MIDRVNNNIYTNAYSNKAVKRTQAEDTPAFLLNYDEKGVVWDRSNDEAEKEKSVSENNSKDKLVEELVIKKKNVNTKDTYESTITDADNHKNDFDILDDKSIINLKNLREMFRQIFSGVTMMFKSVFNFVWYGNDIPDENAPEKANKETTEETTEKISEKTIEKQDKRNDSATNKSIAESQTLSKEELIRKSISNKDTDEIMRLLTDNYANKPARNTALLTQYDKYGNIVSVSGADEARILKNKKSINM